MSDSQDRAEAIDEEVVSEGYPPDAPMGIDEHGVTAAEEGSPESFEERTAREDRSAFGPDRPVVRPLTTEAEDVLDDEAQLVAEADPADPAGAGDDEPVPAEEAAMHIEGDDA